MYDVFGRPELIAMIFLIGVLAGATFFASYKAVMACKHHHAIVEAKRRRHK